MDINTIDDAIQRLSNDVEVEENHALARTLDLTRKSRANERKLILENRNRAVYAATVRFLEDVGLREPIEV